MVNSKHAFWQALVFTGIIFGIGLMLGFFLENSRANSIERNIFNSELNLLDDELRNRVITDFEVDCDTAKQSTFDFANKIYEEAIILEEVDGASNFMDLFEVHRRYDLLRTTVWLESIELRKNCGDLFHTFVYFYEYQTEDIDISSQQLFYSRLLFDLKLKYPDEVILIPVAGNTELSSIELILKEYGIEELPVIIIDEEHIISGFPTFKELENYLKDSPLTLRSNVPIKL